MNVRDILDVKAICDAGSLRKAAVTRGVTQPTLSNRIAHLETQLGAPLFDRSRGQTRPTQLALLIASRAGAIAEEATRVTQEVKRLAAGQGGVVRIGLGPGPMRLLLAGIVAEISDRYPDISLELASGATPQLMERLVSRSVDLLVCPFLEPHDAVIESEPLLETSIVIVARPDHPICTKAPASLRELLRYPIATSIVDPRYLAMVRTSYGIDLEAQVGRIVCSDFDLLIRTVSRSNRLFTVGPRFAFASEIASGQLKVVELAVPFRHSIGLHLNRLAYPLPAVAKVLDIIRQAFVAIRADEARLSSAT